MRSRADFFRASEEIEPGLRVGLGQHAEPEEQVVQLVRRARVRSRLLAHRGDRVRVCDHALAIVSAMVQRPCPFETAPEARDRRIRELLDWLATHPAAWD